MNHKIVVKEIHMTIDSKHVATIRPTKIAIQSETEGTVVHDGRPVQLIGGVWTYEIR